MTSVSDVPVELLVSEDVLRSQSVDSLHLGLHTFELERKLILECGAVVFSEAHGYNIKVKCHVSASVAAHFVDLLRTKSVDSSWAVDEVMDMWLLAHALQHKTLSEILIDRLLILGTSHVQ